MYIFQISAKVRYAHIIYAENRFHDSACMHVSIATYRHACAHTHTHTHTHLSFQSCFLSSQARFALGVSCLVTAPRHAGLHVHVHVHVHVREAPQGTVRCEAASARSCEPVSDGNLGERTCYCIRESKRVLCKSTICNFKRSRRSA